MWGPGGCVTLEVSEFPNVAVESSLLDILEEPGPHLAKYFLSPKSCRGILRRATRRRKHLPALLEQALTQVASRE